MTDYGDTSVWILITDGTDNLYLKTDVPPKKSGGDPSAVVIDYPTRGHFGFTLHSETVKIKINKVYAVTEAEWKSLIQGIIAMQDTDSTIYYRLQISSTPSYMAWDGNTKIYMPVLIKDVRDEGKLYGGDSTVFEIAQILLLQSGPIVASI